MSLALTVAERYLADYPVAAAHSLEAMGETELERELVGVRPQVLLPVLEVLGDGHARACFAALDESQRVEILRLASPRLALVLLDGMKDEMRESLLRGLPDALRDDLERLEKFPDDTAGRLMEHTIESFRLDTSVGDALDTIRHSSLKQARSIYVVDENYRLIGKVHMQSLALAQPDEPLGGIVEGLEGVVSVTSDREDIVDQLNRFRVDSIPVVDVEGRLMGVVRHQRLFEAVESVATADLQKMVGVSPDERALSAPMFSVRKRLPWLHINLLTAFLAAAVVGMFESVIAQFTALAVLLPVVAGQSGNAGSQALAVTMRGLALREVGTRDWRRVLGKEVQVGVVDGIALALTCGLGVFVWSQSFGLAIVIAVAMVLSMVAAGISGALVPMILTRIGQDPATASSIILTTVTDVAGFLSFLGTATALSSML